MSFYEPSIAVRRNEQITIDNDKSVFCVCSAHHFQLLLYRSLLKTISMTTGEQEFDSIFHQEASGARDTLEEIPFPFVSFLVWILFIVFIPVLLINMLVCCVE